MRLLLGLSVCVLAIGCGNGTKAPDATKPDPVIKARTTVTTTQKVEPPNFDSRTQLRMIRKGDELRVGDSIDSALRAFPEEKNAYKVNEMPPGWKDPAYSSEGWDNGTTGFAAIIYDGKVALALYHEDRADETRLQEILDVYDRMTARTATKVTGSKVRYWFWEEETQRLMICAVQTPDGISIAISLGDKRVMDILGMNPLAADKDRQSAETLFQEAVKTKQGK